MRLDSIFAEFFEKVDFGRNLQTNKKYGNDPVGKQVFIKEKQGVSDPW